MKFHHFLIFCLSLTATHLFPQERAAALQFSIIENWFSVQKDTLAQQEPTNDFVHISEHGHLTMQENVQPDNFLGMHFGDSRQLKKLELALAFNNTTGSAKKK